jgi:predicted ferric reductase
MPVLVAILYWIRILRRPMDARLKRRYVGEFAIGFGAAALITLWINVRPRGFENSYFWGELTGVMAIYLYSWTLLLATRARWLEPLFGGLDRMYLWHKRSAIAASMLLFPHALITGSAPHKTANQTGLTLGVVSLLGLLVLVIVSIPRAGRILRLPYERWLFLHRVTGLFVVIGVIHGLSIDQIIGASLLLKLVYSAIGAVGIGAYTYSETLMRRRIPKADYTIATVSRPADEIVELTLTPTGPGVRPQAGQFIFLSIGGDDAWREHPFSVAGTTPDGGLRLSIRALGRDTRRMHARLEPGLPAIVTGPYGMFDLTLGGPRQLWIAGGIGVVPFLSWLQALTPDDGHSIDLFYSVPTEADALYLPELRAAGLRLPAVRIHPIFTRTQGHLTGATLAAQIAPLTLDEHVFLCGPTPMVEDLTRDLHRQGTPREYLHFEHFSFR